ncbi:MAG: secretin N-terminal domain-containing protein, partial [Planctomycetota bacterium]
ELDDGSKIYSIRHYSSRTNPPLDPVTEIVEADEELPAQRDEQIATLVLQLEHVESTVVVQALREILEVTGSKSQTGTLKIVTLPQNETLIIKSKIRILRHVKDLVRYIDIEIKGPEQLLQVRELYYADAFDMVDILQQALEGVASANPTGSAPRPAAGNARTARRTTGGTQVGNETRLIPDSRTQKLLIQSTSPEEVDLVHLLCDELDTRLRNTRANTHVYRVKFLRAADLRDTVTQLIEGSGGGLSASRTTPGRGATGNRTTGNRAGNTAGSQLVASRIVNHDETNSLLIQADPEEYEEILGILESIDRKRRQVFLEAALVQVSDTSSLNYTIEYLAGDLDDSATRLAAMSAFGLSGLDVTQLPGAFTRAFNADASQTGLLAAVSRDGQLPVLLRAIKTDTDSQILATPFILADDNQTNALSVQTEVFFETSSQGQVAVTSGQDSEQAGITLTLTPTISGSVVLLELELEVSSFGGASTGTGAVPDKATNTITSNVTIPNAELFVIGGLARENSSTAVDKIPLLGDLPLIGRLFQSRGSTKGRDNLYVFLTAHILDDSSSNDLRHFTRQAVEGAKAFDDEFQIQQFAPFDREADEAAESSNQ